MKKTTKKTTIALLVMSVFLLSACTSLSGDKYKKLDEFVEDIDVIEREGYGLVIVFHFKGGGKLAWGAPGSPECRAGFGGEEKYMTAESMCGIPEALPANAPAIRDIDQRAG